MIQLREYPLRQKGDDVDWDKMPTERCDMNFRPLRNRAVEMVALRTFIATASVCSALALVAISLVNLFWPFVFTSLESLLLLILAAAFPIAVMAFRKNYELGVYVYAVLVSLLLITNFGELFYGEYRGNYYSVIFLFAIVPFVIFVLDQLACHYVYWVTASPALDLKTMMSMRGIWAERFGKGFLNTAHLKSEGRIGKQNEITDALKLISYYPIFLFVAYLLCIASVFFANLFAKSSVSPQASLVVLSIVLIGTSATVHYLLNRSFNSVVSAVCVYCVLKRYRKLQATIQFPELYQTRANLLFASILVLSFAVSSFWFPWTILSFGIVGSATSLVFNAALQFTIIFLLAPILFFALANIAIGPVLRTFELACESQEALLANEHWTEFDGYQDRLRFSRNPDERESIWMGFHKEQQFPILVPVSLVKEHVHMLGGSGSGKTGLGVATMVSQMIKRNKGPVIVIDAKGDSSLLQATKRWTEEENRKFKWFTTAAGKSTYLFNPFGQKFIEGMTLSELVGFVLLSFNMFHGSDYGRSWFSQASKSALTDALKMSQKGGKRVDCLSLFLDRLEEIITQAEPEYRRAATQILLLLRSLSEFPQLQKLQDETGRPHPASEHAIEMLDVIENNQVVYFAFPSLTDPSSAGELSRMVTYSAIAGAMDFFEKTQKIPDVTIVIDEAQNVAAKNLAQAVEQARQKGVSFVFAHQTRDQMKLPGGVDLRTAVDSCTTVKQYFSATDPESIQYLMDISGEVGYYTATWKQFVHRILAGDVRMGRAVSTTSGPATADVTTKPGPRLTRNEIEDASLAENECILAIKRQRGLAQNRGAFPIHFDYPITKDQYEANQKKRWPGNPLETISPSTYWPPSNEQCSERETAPEILTATEDDLHEIFRLANKNPTESD